MKGKIKNIIISLLLIICCSTALVGCTNGHSTVLDVAKRNGIVSTINNSQSEKYSTPDTTNSTTTPQITQEITNLTINNSTQEFDVYETYKALKENEGYTGSFSDFLNDYVYTDSGKTSEMTNSINKNLFSVVSIVSEFKVLQLSYSQFVPTVTHSAGSGVIYQLDKSTGDAYIITNHHVLYLESGFVNNSYIQAIDGDTGTIAQKVYCYLYGTTAGLMDTQTTDEDGFRIYQPNQYAIECTYVGGSADYDIAVLKVSNSELLKNSDASAVTIADSKDITVGEDIFAIGNPEASGISVTKGIICVDSEYIDMNNSTYRVIRIDAAVNGGNSGGGLFNASGELIGIVNAKIISSDVENIGYAIPSNVAIGITQNILKNCGEGTNNTNVKRALVGITLKTINSRAVYNSGTGKTKIIETVSIDSITQGSLAENSTLEENQIITKIIISYSNSSIPSKEITVERLFDVVDSSLPLTIGDTITFHLKDSNGNDLPEVSITISENALSVVK